MVVELDIKQPISPPPILKNKGMAQYINKDALVAEIESLKCTTFTNFDEGVNCAVQTLLEIIDKLEVKEVDLKKELKEDWLFADKTEVDCLESVCLTEDMFVSLAKKYFQLGLKAQNERKSCTTNE